MGASLLQRFQLADRDYDLKGSVYSDTNGFFIAKLFKEHLL